MNVRKTMLTAVAVMGAIALAGCGPAPVDLAFRPNPGDVWSVTLTKDLTQSISMMGQSEAFSEYEEYRYTVTVEEADAGGAVVLSVNTDNVTQRGAMFDMMTAGAGLELDGVMAAVNGAQTSTPVTMFVDSTGRIQRLEGADAMLDAAMAQANVDRAFAQMLRPMLEAQIGEEAQRSRLQTILPQLHDGPVREGTPWHVTDVSEGEFPLQMDSTATLTRIAGNTAYVEADVVLSVADGGADMFELSEDTGGKQTLTAEVDLDTGWLMNLNARMDLSGELSLPMFADIGADFSMPFTQSGSITVSAYKQ